jgi:hypothetical protein
MLRTCGWLAVLVSLVLFGIAVGVSMARASGEGGLTAAPDRAEPYREGPLEQRSAAGSLEWPQGAEELLALGVITAILCGFRASGLARQGRADRRSAS